MTKKLISLLIANLFVAAPTCALGEDFVVDGSVSLGAIHVSDKDQDPAKLREYRDLTSGALSEIELKGRGNGYWLDLFGENFGRTDQYLNVRGGLYDSFKYRLYTDSLTHNFLFNGKSPYNGNGSTLATQTFPQLNPALWGSVNVGYKRRDDGLMFEYQKSSPWYFRVEGNQVTTHGTKIGSSSQGTSPGNGFVDLSFPVEYKTRNATIEGGYSSKTIAASIAWMTSKFDNDNQVLNWTNGYFGNKLDTTYLPPNNTYQRLAANLTFRQLPVSSTLAVRYTQDELKADADLVSSYLDGTSGQVNPTNPSEDAFRGKIKNQTFTVALASTPMKGLDTRLFYNYFKREDKSSLIEFTPAGGTVFENDPLDYTKHNYGIDAYFRLNRGNRFGAGYDYTDVKRTRFDFNKTTDDKFFLEYKNTMLDNLSARVKYISLTRKSDFLLANDGVNTGDPNYENRFITAFDLSNMDQDQWRIYLDYTPVPLLDLGFEGAIKNNKYKKNVLGRLKDDRREYYVNAAYGDPSVLRFTVFGDIEDVKYQSQHRIYTFGSTALGTYDPLAPATATNYNWVGNIHDKNWAYGVALDWPANEKLMVKATAMYYKTDGNIDFERQVGGGGSSLPPVDLTAFDDSKRTSYTLKGIYTVSPTVTVTGGIAYEKFTYSDAQVDGYRYTIPAATRQDSYLNGYYANPQYKGNWLFFTVRYKF